MFDRDGDGRISASELSHAFRMQGQNVAEDEIRNIIKEVDVDGEQRFDSLSLPVADGFVFRTDVCGCRQTG